MKMSPNEKRIREWERECARVGRHIPWVTVGGFGSIGMQQRIRGRQDQLVAHLQADGEAALFVRLAFEGGYRRILTQVPLTPLQLAVDLTRAVGLRYPWDADHRDWAVMSTDVVTEKIVRGELRTRAYSVKPRAVAEGTKASSVENNFGIEKVYWKYRRATCTRVYSEDLSATETENIFRLYDVLNQHGSEVQPLLTRRFAGKFSHHWREGRVLSEILRRTERDLRVSAHTGWVHFAAAIQSKAIRLDLAQERLGEFRTVWLKT